MDVYEKAILVFGIPNRLDSCINELAELIEAIHKYQIKKLEIREMVENVVDVEIILEQIRRIIKSYVNDDQVFDLVRKQKLSRLGQSADDHHREYMLKSHDEIMDS